MPVRAENSLPIEVQDLAHRHIGAEIAVATHRDECDLGEQTAHQLDITLTVAEEDHRVRRTVTPYHLLHKCGRTVRI